MQIGDIVTVTKKVVDENCYRRKKSRKISGKLVQITDKHVTLQLKYYKESFPIEDIIGG